MFRVGDPESLSQVLSRVMEHPELRSTMSARAFEAYERRFNWETYEVNLLRVSDMISQQQRESEARLQMVDYR